MTLLESITQHQTILNDVKMNGVPSVLLGSVVSEGGGHRCLAYEPIIGAYGGISASSVPVPQLDMDVLIWNNTYL